MIFDILIKLLTIAQKKLLEHALDIHKRLLDLYEILRKLLERDLDVLKKSSWDY